jgi:uncharacterized protein YbjT (DUF2867 family)
MKTAIIIGATGLIGNQLLELLCVNSEFNKIHIITRTAPNKFSESIDHISLDNGNYTIPKKVDMAFCCLGTTMKKAGSKEAFRAVDLHMVINFAKKAKDAGVKRFAVVSSIGANPKSSNFYLKTKGQMEEELKRLGFDRLAILRPSLLLGIRKEKRISEDIGKVLYSIFRFIFVGPLKKYRGIHARDVAKAMIALTGKGEGSFVVESSSLILFSKHYDESMISNVSN